MTTRAEDSDARERTVRPMLLELPGGLRLARGAFDIGLLAADPDRMMTFWHGQRRLPLERVFEPSPGTTQYRLDMYGAVLKLNAPPADAVPPTRLGAVRLLRIIENGLATPRHERDPDGNLVQLVPPGGMRSLFAVHLAVSDESAAAAFYGRVLGLQAVDDRSYDVGGATISFSFSPDVVPRTPGAGRGVAYLTLQVMDVVATHALLCRRGATGVMAPNDQAFAGGSTVSFVADPDGNLIELSQRPDLVRAAASVMDQPVGDTESSRRS